VAAEVVPRANVQLAAVITKDGTARLSDRTMTIGQLREAERNVNATTGSDALARVSAYEVEVQKKLALAAACVALALAAVAIALRVPRGGLWLVVGASLAVFWAYYMLIIAGETLADRMVVSPFVGMWWANAFLLALASLLIAWPRRAPRAPGGGEAVVARG
jgi:lipopolysaccharide export LptBFGC system permease protein LptF